ncbi:MAG: hypothetical protein EP330_13940 [Deltaproteobacteria bacterium]|nr:MAG: hypothetical protein EP330_13940 [Deltaproteobacteria bacterium]
MRRSWWPVTAVVGGALLCSVAFAGPKGKAKGKKDDAGQSSEAPGHNKDATEADAEPEATPEEPAAPESTPEQVTTVCPCWASIEDMDRDLSAFKSELAGDYSCLLRQRDEADFGETSADFLRPGCELNTCGSMRFTAAWNKSDPMMAEPDAPETVHHCRSDDMFNGAPPAGVYKPQLTPEERVACAAMVVQLADKHSCSR